MTIWDEALKTKDWERLRRIAFGFWNGDSIKQRKLIVALQLEILEKLKKLEKD
jgi:hypothetical protein